MKIHYTSIINFYAAKVRESKNNLKVRQPSTTITYTMAQQIELKEFLELVKKEYAAKAQITIKTNLKVNAKGKTIRQTKFKLRAPKHKYTTIVDSPTRAKQVKQVLTDKNVVEIK